MKSLHYLIDLQLSRGIDMKFEVEINKRVNDVLYLPHIMNVFSEILAVFSKHKKAVLLRPCFTTLLTFNLNELFISIVPRLPEILAKLIPDPVYKELKKEPQSEEAKFRDIVMTEIKKLWKAKNTPWRNLAILIDSISKSQAYFPLELYNHYFLDEFFSSLKISNSEIQKVLIRAICKLLVCSYSANKRGEVLGKLVALSNSKSFYERRLFLLFCGFAIENFPLSVITRIELIKHYLKVATDKVSNIRLAFLNYAITMWKYSQGEARTEILTIIAILKQDKDKEVRNVAERVYSYIRTHSAGIVKDDVFRRKENECKENIEKGLIEKEKEIQEERKKSNQSSIFKIKSIRKKSLNTVVARYRKGLTINQNLAYTNSVGTRNRTNRSYVSFYEKKYENKNKLSELPSFGQAETKSTNMKIKKVQYSPERVKSKYKEPKFRK